MAQETLKLVITADTAEALANLQTFIKANKGLKEEMQKIGPVSNQATNALTNLSRVAQDAPYGFIGIANNLNPLLESFQRLSVGAKDAGTSLTKELGKALTGPAGIGLALGVVSSLLIKFGDDISAFIDKTLNGSNAINEQAKALGEAKKAFADAYVEMSKLGQSFEEFNNGTKSKKSVLEEYNKSLGKVYGTTKDVNEAEKVYRENTDKYIQATYLRAAADIELKKAAEEAAKAAEASKMPATEFTPMFGQAGGFGAGATPTKALNAQREANRRDRINELNDRKKFYEDVAKQLRDEADLIDSTATKTKNFGKDDVKPSPIVNYAREENKALTFELFKMKALREKMKKIGLEPIKLFELPSEERAAEKKRKSYFDGKLKDLLEESDKSGFGAKMQGIFKKDKTQLDTEAAEKKRIDDLTQSYSQFAETISSNVTNALFGMYDAMQQGQNPLEALANMFLQISKNIAAMVIQALIFEQIMKAFPALKGAFTALGAVGNLFGGAKAAGAIAGGINPNSSFNAGSIGSNNATQGEFVLRGSDLVLATQRANNNLNIRRGY